MRYLTTLKRFIACLAVLAVGLTGVPALAEQQAVSGSFHVQGDVWRQDDFLYRVQDDGTVEIVEYIGLDGVEEIPSTLGGHPVTVIGDKAFSNEGWIQFYTDDYPIYLREYIRTIRVPEGVTRIGAYAFESCFNLTELTLPATLTEIGEGAFDQCDNLTSVTLPDQLTTLGAYAFRGCTSLVSMNIPDSLVSMGDNPFADCTHLRELRVSAQHPSLRFEDGMLYSVPDMRLILCSAAAWGETAVLPEGTRIIGASAFASATFTSIPIPDSVHTIERYAFSDCAKLTALSLPASVQTIGDNPVIRCFSLTAIVLKDTSRYTFADNTLTDRKEGRLIAWFSSARPTQSTRSYSSSQNKPAELDAYGGKVYLIEPEYSSYTDEVNEEDVPAAYTVQEGIRIIGAGAFYGAAVREIILPDTVQEIRAEAFASCEYLQTCRLPAGIDRIPDRLFYNCNKLAETNIPDGVTEIGAWAFAFTALNEVVMPSSVTAIGPYVFAYSSTWNSVSITLSERLTCIPKGAFAACNIQRIDLPDGIVRIENEAFSRTLWLESIKLPAALTSIAEYCFYDSYIESVALPPELEYIGDQAFRADDYGSGCLSTSLVLPDSVRYVGTYAFRNQNELQKAVLPGGIEWLGKGIFLDCHSLETVVLGEGITMIPNDMVARSGVKEIQIPESVELVCGDAFYNSEITRLSFPNPRLRISGNPFYCTPKLESVAFANPSLQVTDGLLIDQENHRVIACLLSESETPCVVPEGVEIIGDSAFCGSGIAGVVLPQSLKRIENYAFFNCYEMEEIDIPDQVEWIGDYAFAACKLKEIRLPSGLQWIGDGAFDFYYSSCPDELVIPSGVRRIGQDALYARRVVFSASPVEVPANPFCSGVTEVVIPDDHPTLKVVNGNVYSADERRLICQLTDAPIEAGTTVISEGALRSSGLTILPDSLECIRMYGVELNHQLYGDIYAAPGTVAEAFFGIYH